MVKASEICRVAADLVGGERDRLHGTKRTNFQNIADHWNAYLGARLSSPISPQDVALMMCEMKIARTKHGAHNPDDYVDLAGYGGCAGEMAAETEIERSLRFGDTTHMETTGPLGGEEGAP